MILWPLAPAGSFEGLWLHCRMMRSRRWTATSGASTRPASGTSRRCTVKTWTSRTTCPASSASSSRLGHLLFHCPDVPPDLQEGGAGELHRKVTCLRTTVDLQSMSPAAPMAMAWGPNLSKPLLLHPLCKLTNPPRRESQGCEAQMTFSACSSWQMLKGAGTLDVREMGASTERDRSGAAGMAREVIWSVQQAGLDSEAWTVHAGDVLERAAADGRQAGADAGAAPQPRQGRHARCL